MPPVSKLSGMSPTSPKTSITTELGVLGLCLFSGMVGLYFQDIRYNLGVLLTGLGLWLIPSVPEILRTCKQRAIEKKWGIKTQPSAPSIINREVPPPAEAFKLIQARRSIYPKDYNGKKLSSLQVETLLEAANWAPTHNLTQPWRFIVLAGNAKKQFEDLTVDLVEKLTEPPEKASEAAERLRLKASKTWPLVSHYLAIIMSRDPSAGGKKFNPEWEDIASVACAVQNMHLLATSMGIAAYWSSWQAVARDAGEMRAFLGLKHAGDRCLGVFCLGNSDRIEGYNLRSLSTRGPMSEKVQWRN